MAKKQPPAYLSQPSDFDFAAGDRFIASLQQSTPPEPEKPSVARRIGDVGLSLGQGALGSFKSISDFLGADNPVSGGLDDASKFLGAQKSAQSQAATQASMARIKEAEASGSKLDEAQAYLGMLWDQPAEMIAQGVGSFATLGVGKVAQALKLAQAAKAAGVSKDVFLASGAAKQAVEEAAKFGFKTNIGLGAVQGVGAVKGSQFEQTYENARQQGMPEEEARALAAQAQEYGGAGTMQQVLGGVLGGVASATGPIERTLLGAGKKPVQSGVMSSVAKGFGKEFATEGGQGAQERFAGNDAAVDAGVLAPERRMQGVVGQGLMEGTIGGLLGGITGPLEGQAAALDPAVNPAKEAADAIRATEKLPESGALTRAMNAGVEAKAQAIEAGAPLVDEQAIAEPEPVDDPVRDQILALPDGARQDALRAYAVLNRPDAAKGVLQLNRKLLDRLLAENAPPPVLGERLTDTDMGSMLGGGGMAGLADPLADRLRQAVSQADTVAPTDILNPAGEPFKTRMAADRAAKKTPGAVVPVEGGFVVRPQESVNVQDVPQAPEVPQAAPAISQPSQAPQAVGAQPAGPAAGVPTEGAGAVEAAGVEGVTPSATTIASTMAADGWAGETGSPDDTIWTKQVNGETYTARLIGDGMEVTVPVDGVSTQIGYTTTADPAAAAKAANKAVADDVAASAPATHSDPGQKPEAATPAVVADSLKKAARNEDTKPSEMRKWLVGEIDKELLQAADRPDYDEAVKRLGEKDAISMFTGNGPLGKNNETGYITFDVPGDGKYKVRNSVRGLLEFRKNVMASQGFKDSGQKRVKPEQNDGVQGGSGGSMTAIANMIEEGDFEAARDYAEAVGISLDDVKVPKGERKTEWEMFRKTGFVPRLPDTRPQPAPKTAAQLDEEKRQAAEAEEKRPKDTGWNMAGTGYGGKRYIGRNITLDDGRQVVARVYENAGNYDEVEVKVDGVRKFTVRDSYNAQDKADAFIKTLTGAGAIVAVDKAAIAPESVTGKDLRERISAWAKAKWGDGKNEDVKNPKWGSDITITWQGIKHAISNANDPELRLIAGITELIGKASHVESHPDKRGRDDVKAVHTFSVKANLGGEALDVGIVVRELKDGHKFYDHFIIKSETPSGISGSASSVVSDGLGAPASDGVRNSLPQPPEGYKPAGEPFYRAGKQIQGYAPFTIGERVTMKDSAGQSGVIESLASPDDSGVFASAVVKFDNGMEQMVQFGKLEAAAPQPDTPKLTSAEAKSLMAWEDMGQKDGVKTHALTFYESQADKDAKRGRMIVAKVSKGDRSATAWMVDGEDKTFGMLAQAKKLAEEVGMARAVADGFVEQGDDAPMFSRAQAKEVRNLVTLHNLTDENLRFADSMGGIPVPSIGITKVDSPFSGFGNITLIAPKGMVDPESGVPVFDRDAWTARFPEMNFKKPRRAKADAFYERMKAMTNGLGVDEGNFLSNLWESMVNASVTSPDKVADYFQRYDAARMAYARDVLGKNIKVPMRSVPLSSPAANDKQLQAYWKKNGQRLIALERELSGSNFSNTPEYKSFVSEVEGAVRRYAEASGKPERADAYVSMFLPDGELGPGGFDRLGRDFAAVGKKEVDALKLREAVRKVVPDNDPGYLAWVSEQVKPLFDAPTITLRGKEVEPTLDNIVDAMTVGATAGVEKSMTFGPGKLAAHLGKRFKSMAEIKAARDQVVSESAETEAKKATDAILDEYRTHLAQFFTFKDWRGNIDTWAANDSSMEALARAGKQALTDANIRAALSRKDFKGVDQRGIDLARQAIEALLSTATNYFEAKPQRAVRLNEFNGAVVPKGISPESVAILEKNGIAVEFYGKAEGAREKAIEKLAKRLDRQSGDVLFSRSATPSRADSNASNVATQQLVDGLKAKWTRAPEIIVARNMQDAQIPQEVRDYDALLKSQGATGEPRGFIYKGKVYLLSDQLKGPQQIAEVLFHEVLGHYGLHGAFGDALTPILKQIAALRRADVQAKAKEYGLDMSKEAGRLQAAEEVLAEMAQTTPELGYVKRAIAAIRNWLRANVPGFKNLSLTDADIIQAYILPARGFVTRSKETGAQSLERAMAAFSRDTNTVMTNNDVVGKQGGRSADDTTPGDLLRKLEGTQVVDPNGAPLLVYHGSKSQIDRFDASKTIDGGLHFGSKSQASMRSSKILHPAYLYAKNLRRSKDTGSNWKAKIASAKAAGYDGIVYLNRYEGVSKETVFRLHSQGLSEKLDRMSDAEFRRAVPEAEDSYIVFDAKQVIQQNESSAPDSAGAMFSRSQSGDQTQTDAFKRWFKDSKVVDAKGKPLVVYHGTGADFSEFSASKIGSAWGADTVGFFFTDSAKTASSYATSGGPTLQRDDGANIIPAYIRISRPVTVEELEAFTGESGLADAYESPIELMDERRDDIMSMLLGNEQDGWSIDKDSKPSVNNTHDGVIFSFGGSTLVVAVDPAQIKSAIGNRGTFDPTNPDIRFSRATAASIASSMGELTPDQEQAYKNVAGMKAVPTVRERMDSLKANLGLKLRQGLVDQFAAIKQLDQNAYVQARMSKGTDGTLEAILMYGKPFMREGAPDVDIKDGGFAKVLASLKGEQDRWMMWIAAQRAEKLKAEGKENLMTDDDISALKTLNAGKMADGTARALIYAKALQELNAYNDAMLKLAMDSGLIDQAAYDLMAGQPYVPFYRLMEDGDMKGPKFSSGLTNQKAWQKLKGGTQQLNADLLQNMLLNWSHLLQASAKNRAATATMDAAEKMAVAYKVDADTKGSVKVMRDGSAEHWMVEDPYLLDAISAIHYVPSPLMKPLAKFKQLLTWGVTVNPTFKIRNLIRDSVSAIAQSELGYNPAGNVAKGWKLTAKDSQIYASMLASGGLIKFGTQENTDRLRAQVAKLGGVVLDKSGADRLFGQIKDLYDVYNEFGDRAENVNRAALYDALIKKGKTHAEAAFMARDLMDFSMGGSAPVVRFLTQTVPFLNARLVGLDKLGRAAMEDPRRFAAVTGAVALASLALMAGYSDDEDWKKREDWDRDAYWWFKIGGQAYRIPKPFEVGAIGTLAERTAELMLSDEMTGKRYMERVSHMLSGTFSFNPVPQAFKPLLDLYANKDSFTGRAIESQADQRLRPQDRYSERTPEVAKFLGGLGLPDPAQLVKGEYSALSPKQVEHLIRGYFSWVGTAAMTVSDFGLRPLADRGERPDMRLKDVFIAGNFVESLPTGSSRYVTQMYEQSRQIEQAYASYQEAIKAGDMEKAQSIKESAGPLLRNRPAYTAATRQLAEINRTAKRIEADQAMAGAAKRARLTELERQRHVIAQRVSRLAAATP